MASILQPTKGEYMGKAKALFSPARENAFDIAVSPERPTTGSRRLDDDRAGWMAQRRRLCSPLAKRVSSVLRAMTDSAFVIRRGVLLEHAPGTRNPVTWVDCLAVSAFGAFAINRYDWMGTVRCSANADELLLHEKLGIVSVQTSPLRRAKPALRHLRVTLGAYNCPVECVAVFSALHCVLDPALPETILQEVELHHFMRTRLKRFREQHSQYLDTDRISAHLQSCCADWGKI
ncbi:NERD domain-containing protein [Paraburkholderia sp. BL9I2N2]|uniref:NERD domain-containing protein n=1 Tax=Paraburkholderia sp. BL9I2N2 TaxID=1938809 RepID=UPI001FB2B066|nr:NERD domain-containing protein [Paraburkholderia sp. BL9I2N2]